MYKNGEPTIFDLPLNPNWMHQKRMSTKSDLSWSIVTKKVSDLTENPKNPRRLSDEEYCQIRTSIEKFGIVEKPVINTDGMIIGGHQRLKILKKLGIKQIECWEPSRTLYDSEIDELNIRLNKNHGTFDYDILGNNFEVRDLFEWGFTMDELQISDVEELEAKEEKKKGNKKKSCPNCGHEF